VQDETTTQLNGTQIDLNVGPKGGDRDQLHRLIGRVRSKLRRMEPLLRSKAEQRYLAGVWQTLEVFEVMLNRGSQQCLR